MRWMDKLERNFGDWSIPQFPLFIAAANGLIYLLDLLHPGFAYRLLLDPAAVHAGEWWRIVTFLFVPPRWSPIGMAIWLYLLYQYSTALENEWGEFRFCFFYLVGALATMLGALFIAHDTISNVPLNTTLFLAFAALFPDFELLLFFFLPVKVKYMAWGVWLMMGWHFLWGGFVTRVAIGTSLLNYAIFFGPELWEQAALKWQVYKNRRRMRGPRDGD
jgi:membrane associated rhomboid family serine protease